MSEFMIKMKNAAKYVRSFVYCSLAGRFLAISAWADADISGGKKAIIAVLNILYLIALIVGIIFIAVGIIRFAMSHAQEDGPGQQKAIMMMATGAVLVIGRVILSALHVENWLDNYTIQNVDGFLDTIMNLPV